MAKLTSAGFAVVLSMALLGCAQEPTPGEDDVGELDQEALAASLTISPTTYSFGSVLVGASSANLGLTVRNRGLLRTLPLSVSLSGSGASHFVIVSNACAGARLAAGASCSIVARFAPTAAGVRSATLAASASGAGSAAATLSGTGIGPAALAITPPSYDYGAVAVGTSRVASFTVVNSGGASSGVLTRGISDAARFPVLSDGCSGTVLAAGASCTIAVAFAPSDAGARSATLTVSAVPGGTVSATLAGTGVVPAQLVISATTQDYGAVAMGGSASYTFVISNPGTLASGVLSGGVSDAADFPVLSDSCIGQVLAAGATCTVTVAFAPTSAGAHSATLSVSATPGGTTSATLSGFGTAPAQLVISATAHDYGAVSVGGSASYTFVVSNVGTMPSGMLTSAVSDVGNFPILSDACSGAMLAAGATCSITVSFRPTSTGPRSATLAVSGLPGGTSAAALTGTGI